MLESPLDSKDIKLVNTKEDQSWIFIEKIDDDAPIRSPPDGKSWLIGKDPELTKIEGRSGWQDGWMASPTQWIGVWAIPRIVKDSEAWGAVVTELDMTYWLNNTTKL